MQNFTCLYYSAAVHVYTIKLSRANVHMGLGGRKTFVKPLQILLSFYIEKLVLLFLFPNGSTKPVRYGICQV